MLFGESVRPCCDEEGRGTYSSGASSSHDPVPFHAADETQCRECHRVGLLVQIEMSGKAVDEEGGINDFEFEAEQSPEFEKARS